MHIWFRCNCLSAIFYLRVPNQVFQCSNEDTESKTGILTAVWILDISVCYIAAAPVQSFVGVSVFGPPTKARKYKNQNNPHWCSVIHSAFFDLFCMCRNLRLPTVTSTMKTSWWQLFICLLLALTRQQLHSDGRFCLWLNIQIYRVRSSKCAQLPHLNILSKLDH